LQPSRWVEQNVVIPDNGFNAEPGPFRFDRTPYWREVLDTLTDTTVREIWVYKANQVGFTQLMMAAAAYCAAQDPGALALLMPDEDSVDELFAEQLVPLINASPEVAKLKTGRAWDSTSHELWLSTMPILGIYSGSAAKLEKRPLRYVIADEINLLKDLPGESSAIQRSLKRITTWQHRGKALFGSKPTTTDGAVTKGYESSPDKRRYLMPCARCGKYHEWLWSQVKGFRDAPGNDKWDRANWVKLNHAAHYECPNCRGVVTEPERLACVRAGRWVSGTMDGEKWSPAQKVSDSGTVSGNRVASERVGFYAWSIVSPWVPMHMLAGEFIEAEGDADRTRGFRNARLALPYHEVSKSTRPSAVRDKRGIAPPPLIVPRWTTGIFTTVDVQADWVRYVIRAWGGGFKSQLLVDGFIHESNAPVAVELRKEWVWAEMVRVGLESRLEVEGGGVASPSAMLVDSGDGGRTNEVYAFADRDPRILPTKGMSKRGAKLFYESHPKPGVRLWMVDTEHYKSALHSLLHDADPTRWLPHNEVSEQYCLEMASESLVKDRGQWRWKENGTARNETWDVEVLQRTAADMFNVAAGATLDQQMQPKQEAPAARQSDNPLTARRNRW
jgi:phage terminase large subunit GpA-like protein